MAGPERLLADRQRAPQERLLVGVAGLGVIERSEVVEARGDIGMVEAERLLGDREVALQERLSIGVAALDAIEQGEVAKARPYIGVLWAERVLGKLHDTLGKGGRGAMITSLIKAYDFAAERDKIVRFCHELACCVLATFTRRRGRARPGALLQFMSNRATAALTNTIGSSWRTSLYTLTPHCGGLH